MGEGLAGISPGGELLQWGTDKRAGRLQYITTWVKFTGLSAGAFGAVVDVRCSVVVKVGLCQVLAGMPAASGHNWQLSEDCSSSLGW